jgi:hypothetical protein
MFDTEYLGYNIVSDGVFGMKLIKNIGRGALPNELKGMYSTTREAMKAIDRVKGNKNGEAVSTD